MDWFGDNPWLGWLGLALILAGHRGRHRRLRLPDARRRRAGGGRRVRRGRRLRRSGRHRRRRRRAAAAARAALITKRIHGRPRPVTASAPAASSAAPAACSRRSRRPTDGSRWPGRPGPRARQTARHVPTGPRGPGCIHRGGHRDRHWRHGGSESGVNVDGIGAGFIVLLLLVVFALIVLFRTVRIVPAADRADHRAAGSLLADPRGRHPLPGAVRRQGAGQHRPA